MKKSRKNPATKDELQNQLKRKTAVLERMKRESKIEEALESVRARTMAMQKSDELRETVLVIYEQLQHLNFEAQACHIIIMDKDSGDMQFWVSGFTQEIYPESYHLPRLNHHYHEDQLTAWKEGVKYAVFEYSGGEKKSFDKMFFTKTDFKKVPEQAKKFMMGLESVTLSTAFFSYGSLQVLGPEALSVEKAKILQRFAKVFEQTYTRFLDLQKAEAQAREAQIQLALEIVRARTMAMQKSEELAETVYILFQQFKELGETPDQATIGIINEKEWVIEYWVTMYGNQTNRVYMFPIDEPNVTNRIYRAWKEQKKSLVIELSGKELYDFSTFRESMGGAAYNTKEKKRVINVAFFSKGLINVQSNELRSAESIRLLERFAGVFEQTYTRFLDLQKAEAQARESHIQLALERVRARTMAMHQSNELAETALLLFQQLQHLGLSFARTGFYIWQKDADMVEGWTSNGALDEILPPLLLSFKEDEGHRSIYEASLKGETTFEQVLGGEELERHYQWLMSQPTAQKTLKKLNESEYVLLETQYKYAAIFKQGYLMLIAETPEPEASGLLQRFANVFEQTYTRLLDLQKAEAQAREAEIQLALERVRARTMAMQKQNDLLGVLDLLVEQLVKLGVNLQVANFSNGIPGGDWDLWIEVAADDGTIFNNYVHFPRIDHPYFHHVEKNIETFRKDGTDLFKDVFSKEEKDSWQDYINTQTIYKDLTSEEIKQSMYEKPGYAWSMVILKDAWVSICRFNTIPFSTEEDAVLRRFAKVFEQTYTRFLDLQKAEAQAREAEIELALERVRARTMAMQHSDELADASFLLDSQIRALGIKTRGCAFNIYGENESMEWFSSEMGTMPMYKTPRENIFLTLYEEGKKGKQMYIKSYTGDACAAHYDYLCTLPVMGEALKQFKASGGSFPAQQIDHVTYFKYGYLLFITLEPVPEAHDIFLRFAKVFEQTYTRFLDLQKAEAQVKEAKIEAALERVRSRSLAMHQSSELSAVVDTLLREFNNLEFTLTFCIINLINEQDKSNTVWAANPEEGKAPESYYMKFEDYPFHYAIWDAWKARKKRFVYTMEGEEKKIYDQYLYSETEFSRFPQNVKEANMALEKYVAGFTFFKYSGLQTVSVNPISEEDLSILERFGRVFEQSYTRFLDLQKAEEQTRESQIQLALERVRARTMAMQHSDELQEVVNNVYERLNELEVRMDGAAICTFIEGTKDYKVWIGDYRVPLRIKFNEFTQVQRDYNDAIERREELFTNTYSGEIKKEYIQFLLEQTVLGINIPEEQKQMLLASAFFTTSLACTKNTVFQLYRYTEKSFSKEENDILKRFANIFEQSYTRFLDLQKAEAQAREAKIEASLERVRSRSMGMQKSAELKEVIQVVYDQFVHLNIHIEHTGFLMDYKERDDMHIWLADQHLVPSEVTIPWFDSPPNNSIKEAKEKGQDFFTYHLTFEEKNKFYRDLFKFIPGVPEETLEYYLNCPGLAGSGVLLDNIGLYIENFSGTPYTDEENKILMRFGKVFQQTYTRFLDLQKAEAQAREAQIEAALERVRSRSIAMRKSEEIADIAGKIFSELKQLDLALNRVLIWTFNDIEKYTTWWSSNPEVESTAESYRIDYNDNPVFINYLQAWQQRIPIHLYFLAGDTKNSWSDFLFEHTELSRLPAAVRKNMREEGDLFTISVISDYGLMMTGSLQPLSDASIDIIQRFGRVFQQSYTRYLDVQKAEAQAREAEIELALERVRARTMAMHSSQDVGDAVGTLYDEVKNLKTQATTCGIAIIRDAEQLETWTVTGRAAMKNPGEKRQLHMGFLDVSMHPFLIAIVEASKNNQPNFTYDLEGESMIAFFKGINEATNYSGYFDIADLPPKIFNKFFFFREGALFVESLEELSTVSAQIFTRFAAVFGQTYRRYLDLKKAEEQAKEAQIEAALEKVRSRTLAMQKSDELAETSAVLFRQLIHLGIEPNRLYIGIMEEKSTNMEFWITDEDGSKVSTMFKGSAAKNASMKKMYDGWKQQKKSIVIDMEGKELAAYFHYLGEELHIPFKGGLSQKRRWQYIAYFSKGLIGMASPEEQLTETLQLLERFAAVFNLTFTRFNDLKIAEAHSLQAEQDLIEIKAARKKAEETLTELQATQKQLIQSEKMASLGELTAGIAHEIQNPLNFVNNFSEVNTELIDELNEEVDKGNMDEVKAIAKDIKENEQKINHHGKRAGDIVKGMLQHSRTSTGVKEPTDINALTDEYFRLAYHGLRAKDKTFNATMKTDFDETIGSINIIPQDIGRVILNLITNAFYAVNEKQKAGEAGYEPTITVSTKRNHLSGGEGRGEVIISVKDNGNGIPPKILDKVFQPFFTTKPTGQGTGLGLSLSYDIVKAHGGEIRVETKEGEGSEFIIQLTVV